MRFSLIDAVSISGGHHNEDRSGVSGATAWVIDGATDVLEERLVPGPSDAAWLADAFSEAFARFGVDHRLTLADCIEVATREVRQRFEVVARRRIEARHEQPSAAGILARLGGGRVDAVGLGDCSLIALRAGASPLDVLRADGRREADEAIRREAARLRAARPDAPLAAPGGVRAELLPMIRAARARLNSAEGYGVLSIDLAPAEHFLWGGTTIEAGDRMLLATDGFMRLVDVYGLYSLDALAVAIGAKGLVELATELRAFEARDLDGHAVPRAKARDDATAMLLEIIA